MPSPEDVFADIEADRSVREAEIRLMQNTAKRASSPEEGEMLRRCFVLLTYAHLEGFCHFALMSYVAAINSLKIGCGNAAYPLAAVTLTKVFAALRNSNSKHPAFRRLLPDDTKLHLIAREAEFVEKINSVFGSPVDIPETAIDLESNLKAVVLKKNLYKLGLDYSRVETEQETLDRLLGIRNAIAHGDRLKVPSESEAAEYSALAYQTMKFILYEIYEALRGRAYLRAA